MRWRMLSRNASLRDAAQKPVRNAANRTSPLATLVMPGLVPGIHVLLLRFGKKDVDGRDEARP